jgi:hypothetical protein
MVVVDSMLAAKQVAMVGLEELPGGLWGIKRFLPCGRGRDNANGSEGDSHCPQNNAARDAGWPRPVPRMDGDLHCSGAATSSQMAF